MKRKAKRDEAYEGLRRFIDPLLTPLLRARLAHQAIRGVGQLWRENASEYCRTLLGRRAASKALALWLLCPPMADDTPCGEAARGRVVVIGPDGDPASHLYKCPCNATPKHNCIVRAMGHILGTRTGCAVLYEQKATPAGRPTGRKARSCRGTSCWATGGAGTSSST